MKSLLQWKACKNYAELLTLSSVPRSCFYNNEWWATANFCLHTAVWSQKEGARTLLSMANAEKKFDHNSDHQISELFERKGELVALSSKGFFYKYTKQGWVQFVDSIMDNKIDGKILFPAVAYDPVNDLLLAYGGWQYGTRQTRVKHAYLFNFSANSWTRIDCKNILSKDYEWIKKEKEDIEFKMLYCAKRQGFLLIGKNESAFFANNKWQIIDHEPISQPSARMVVNDAKGKTLLLDFDGYDEKANETFVCVYHLDFPRVKLIAKTPELLKNDRVADDRNFAYNPQTHCVHFQSEKKHTALDLSTLFEK